MYFWMPSVSHSVPGGARQLIDFSLYLFLVTGKIHWSYASQENNQELRSLSLGHLQ